MHAKTLKKKKPTLNNAEVWMTTLDNTEYYHSKIWQLGWKFLAIFIYMLSWLESDVRPLWVYRW